MKKIKEASGSTSLIVWEYGSKIAGRHLSVGCFDCDTRLQIYAPTERKDDLYEIGGIVGTRKEWAKVFRMAGIL